MREINFKPAPPSGSARHLPINGEDPLGMPNTAPPSGSARHLPMNGEDPLGMSNTAPPSGSARHLPMNGGEDPLGKGLNEFREATEYA